MNTETQPQPAYEVLGKDRPHIGYESNLQAACIEYAHYQYRQYKRLIFAVPNEGKRTPRQGSRMRKQGLNAGTSDIIVLLPRQGYCSLVIEMKTKGNKITDNQKSFLIDAAANGSKSIVCYNKESFIKVLDQYLKK